MAERAAKGEHVRLVFEKGTGRGEGQVHRPLHFAPHGLAARKPREHGVKLGVELDILVEEHVLRPLAKARVELVDEVADRFKPLGRDAALRRKPRRRSLKHTAQLDGVDHVGEREGANGVAARGQRLQQPFLLQPREGRA